MATSHLNTGAVKVNFILSFGHKSIEISTKSGIMGCNSRYPSSFATKRELNLCLYANHHIKALSVRKVMWVSFRWVICTPYWTQKNWFPSTDTQRMIAKTSSHHSSSHLGTKKSHTKFGQILKSVNPRGELIIGQKLIGNHTSSKQIAHLIAQKYF